MVDTGRTRGQRGRGAGSRIPTLDGGLEDTHDLHTWVTGPREPPSGRARVIRGLTACLPGIPPADSKEAPGGGPVPEPASHASC